MGCMTGCNFTLKLEINIKYISRIYTNKQVIIRYNICKYMDILNSIGDFAALWTQINLKLSEYIWRIAGERSSKFQKNLA